MKRSRVGLLGCVALWACSSRAVIGVADGDARAGVGGDGAAASAGTPPIAVGDVGGEGNVDVPGPFDPLFPYPNTNYAEPFRGQFHFSTASGWMNDIDGLWYDSGVYHLTYQASPHAFQGGKGLNWAHATSDDLLHWQQQPLMLVPGLNVEGEAWSGSVVVDRENTAKLQNGAKPVVVAIYTSTTLGTSLAYSNDQGRSFRAYGANPLGIGDADYLTNRDPTVIWHAPSKRWVCAYWENGTTFYTSPDLKTWTRASNVSFGSVVPDFYELPLDGDAKDTRWVLQDSDGRYLLGQFDGQTFTAEPGDPLDMDVGPHFFASHTFSRPTFPDARVVQIGWMKDGGVATAPWRGSATFPVELQLKTLPGGVKLTRTPVSEIEKLYAARKHWDAQTLPAGKNLLAGMRSKTFDFEIVIDTKNTAAGALTFQIANRTFAYDFAKQILFGAALAPDAGQVKIRILVDWGQLEVFANQGELSYTESVAFTPSDASLSVSADGDFQLISADFREVGRAWASASATDARVLDDADLDVGYEGSWTTVTDDATFFADTCHFSKSPNAAFEATFTGTRIDWYGLRNVDLGKADVYVDDVLVASAIDCYAPTRVSAQLFTISALPNTFHSIRIVATGDTNPASTGTSLVHDYFVSSAED